MIIVYTSIAKDTQALYFKFSIQSSAGSSSFVPKLFYKEGTGRPMKFYVLTVER